MDRVRKTSRPRKANVASNPKRWESVPKKQSAPKIKISTDFFISASHQFETFLMNKKFKNFNTNRNPSALFLTTEKHVSSTAAFNTLLRTIDTLQKYEKKEIEPEYLGAMILEGNSVLIQNLANLYIYSAEAQTSKDIIVSKKYLYYAFEYHKIFFNIMSIKSRDSIPYEQSKISMVQSLKYIISYYTNCINNPSVYNYVNFSKTEENHIRLLICYTYLLWYNHQSESNLKMNIDLKKPIADMINIKKLEKKTDVEKFIYKLEALKYIFENGKTYLKYIDP